MVWHQKISPSGLPKLEAAAAEVVPYPAGPCGTADSHQAQQTPATKKQWNSVGGGEGCGVTPILAAPGLLMLAAAATGTKNFKHVEFLD